jgi:uncharacterized protein (TIGR02246 family)
MDQLTASRQAERIRELEESWLTAARQRDVDGMLAIYSPDPYELWPGLPALVGRAAIGDFYSQLLEDYPRFQQTFVMDEVTIAESGDLAVVRGTYRFIPDETKPDEIEIGKFVAVWVFLSGDWRLQTNISNSDSLTGTDA